MSLFHITMDTTTQIFVTGFFAAMMTMWPVCMLFLIPHDVFIAKNQIIQDSLKKQAQLQKDYDQLFLELIDHKAIIDALLTEKMNEQN